MSTGPRRGSSCPTSPGCGHRPDGRPGPAGRNSRPARRTSSPEGDHVPNLLDALNTGTGRWSGAIIPPCTRAGRRRCWWRRALRHFRASSIRWCRRSGSCPAASGGGARLRPAEGGQAGQAGTGLSPGSRRSPATSRWWSSRICPPPAGGGDPEAGGKLVEDVRLFDLYQGDRWCRASDPGLPPGLPGGGPDAHRRRAGAGAQPGPGGAQGAGGGAAELAAACARREGAVAPSCSRPRQPAAAGRPGRTPPCGARPNSLSNIGRGPRIIIYHPSVVSKVGAGVKGRPRCPPIHPVSRPARCLTRVRRIQQLVSICTSW